MNITQQMMLDWFNSQKNTASEQETLLLQINKTNWKWERIARQFGTSYIALGMLSIIINTVIFTCIILRRRNTFSHVFYVIILNFTVIDTIKGICSILFALKLLTSNMSMDSSSWTVKVDQYSGVLLRFTNLTSILNVLLITMNEFIFICYPLRYSTLVTRTRILVAIVSSWLLASILTLVNMLTNVRHRSVMIDAECLEDVENCIWHQTASLSHYFVFHLFVIAFCLIGLAITAGCYAYLFNVISKILKKDAKFQAEVDLLKEEHSHHKSIARRRKYVIIIGSVIVVYSVYLTTYAIIQGMQLYNISRGSTHSSNFFILTKYICYGILSLHSLLQPLCFMRMKEFRNILKRTICAPFRRETYQSGDGTKRVLFQPTDI
ncbi:unnamed protein product [Caenorhabditis bovis]|uniref:G-protein coupled receptors family 1 profile domain-containing protein n=1 Tax=Caenorhabditis bovis TaxID=2654633 RepID=A0A8S1F2L6_9PELO|nr:unnamed protein product [Caenorhabditis bovis]